MYGLNEAGSNLRRDNAKGSLLAKKQNKKKTKKKETNK
jgi:hypothetical protein